MRIKPSRTIETVFDDDCVSVTDSEGEEERYLATSSSDEEAHTQAAREHAEAFGYAEECMISGALPTYENSWIHFLFSPDEIEK